MYIPQKQTIMASNTNNTISLATNDTVAPPSLYIQSVSFAGALTVLLDIIDEVDLNDGQYLSACNALKYLHDNKTEIITNIITNPVVEEHMRRAGRPDRSRQFLTDAQKIAGGRHCRCDRCDRVIVKGSEEIHHGRKICIKMLNSKKLSVKFKKTEVSKYINVITAIQEWGFKHKKDWAYL